jgi:hypothetical protein
MKKARAGGAGLDRFEPEAVSAQRAAARVFAFGLAVG